MADTEIYKEFMSLWAYKYLPYYRDIPDLAICTRDLYTFMTGLHAEIY